MVSLNANPPEGFYLDATGMALPNLGSFSSPAAGNAAAPLDDPSKKVRKPYTITKSRESWTEPEHDKFLEALHLFDRDWKKIEAFVGSKTVIQIRSHAQKYFLKVQKTGTNEHLPPPRPKRKAAHPYPHKASKTAPAGSQELSSFQASPAIPDPGGVQRPDTSTLLVHPETAVSVPGWHDNSMHSPGFSHVTTGNFPPAGQSMSNVYSCGSDGNTPRTRSKVLPDFAQVYGFIGSVFDPNATGHLQQLKKMDPIDIETVLLLMRNLAINLASPEFEDHRRLLSSYDTDSEKDIAFDVTDSFISSQSEDAALHGF
ncbi:protein REVEILLE 6-like [Andrographis paniculata]|uniref:protein REVEILLE 6-like n=1 Tax=Andrographis paniculata TaxID=175694 RepID=UPI0021E809A6|nr:protein REVEILLE 6-like [Andrographis paniculata]XP_051143542.1 protein REVEILLE 6-like [Andrographis paniculata]XP_051143543.1 protein REVEILLE 6-like [Andrographis paniculata]